MRQEAEKYAEQYQRRLRIMELRNQADSLFHTYDTTLQENAALIREELKVAGKQKKDQLAIALRTPNTPAKKLQTLVEEFRQLILQIGTDVYQQANVGSVNEFQDFGRTNPGTFGSMVEPIETQMNQKRSRQRPGAQTMTPGTMINGTVGTPGYMETAPVYGLDEEGEFDFDADETISSDYEAVD